MHVCKILEILCLLRELMVCNTYCGYQCIIYTEEDDTLFNFVRVSDCKNIPKPGIWNIFAVCRMENIYMELWRIKYINIAMKFMAYGNVKTVIYKV